MLSQSVATAIKLRGGDEASETAKFVEMCDKWFDAMNVHNYTQGILVRFSTTLHMNIIIFKVYTLAKTFKDHTPLPMMSD